MQLSIITVIVLLCNGIYASGGFWKPWNLCKLWKSTPANECHMDSNTELISPGPKTQPFVLEMPSISGNCYIHLATKVMSAEDGLPLVPIAFYDYSKDEFDALRGAAKCIEHIRVDFDTEARGIRQTTVSSMMAVMPLDAILETTDKQTLKAVACSQFERIAGYDMIYRELGVGLLPSAVIYKCEHGPERRLEFPISKTYIFDRRTQGGLSMSTATGDLKPVVQPVLAEWSVKGTGSKWWTTLSDVIIHQQVIVDIRHDTHSYFAAPGDPYSLVASGSHLAEANTVLSITLPDGPIESGRIIAICQLKVLQTEKFSTTRITFESLFA